MGIYIKFILVILAAVLSAACSNNSSAQKGFDQKQAQLGQSQVKTTDMAFQVLYSAEHPVIDDLEQGKNINLISSLDDFEAILPDQVECIKNVDFDTNQLVLIKSQQRSASNDYSIYIDSVKAYNYEKAYRNYTKVAVIYQKVKNQACDFNQLKVQHYLLVSIKKAHNDVFFDESLANTDKCIAL